MPVSPSFEDIRALLEKVPPLDSEAAAAIRERDAQLTKPPGSLGRLEEITTLIGRVQGRATPTVDRPLVAVFAGNHGVAAQGVSPYPATVTAGMVGNFRAGGAAINQICGTFGLGLKVFELALETPTGDITIEPAMDEPTCAATIIYGMEAIAGGTDLLCVGEMGIGNTTIAAAIYHGLWGGAPGEWAGRGTGVDDAGLRRKTDAVGRAVALHRPYAQDPFELLQRLGGREIAALVGAILAARIERVPVVLDGFVTCAAAAILHAVDPALLDHCIAGHQSAEGAHAAVLQRLGLAPVLNLGLRLGEGSGAALAAGVIKAAVATHTGMATFAEAGVADRDGA